MKPLTKTSISVAMAAMFLTGAVVLTATAEQKGKKQVPFSGTLQAHEAVVSEDPGTSFVTDGSGDGIATHLGRFTLTWEFTVLLADGTGSGPVRYIAANGDQIFMTAVGQSEPTATPGVFHIVEIQTITGGTGRFAGAQGSFIVDRLVDLATGLTSGSFHGSITSPGAAH